jgi:hypothetical protein
MLFITYAYCGDEEIQVNHIKNKWYTVFLAPGGYNFGKFRQLKQTIFSLMSFLWFKVYFSSHSYKFRFGQTMSTGVLSNNSRSYEPQPVSNFNLLFGNRSFEFFNYFPAKLSHIAKGSPTLHHILMRLCVTRPFLSHSPCLMPLTIVVSEMYENKRKQQSFIFHT